MARVERREMIVVWSKRSGGRDDVHDSAEGASAAMVIELRLQLGAPEVVDGVGRVYTRQLSRVWMGAVSS